MAIPDAVERMEDLYRLLLEADPTAAQRFLSALFNNVSVVLARDSQVDSRAQLESVQRYVAASIATLTDQRTDRDLLCQQVWSVLLDGLSSEGSQNEESYDMGAHLYRCDEETRNTIAQTLGKTLMLASDQWQTGILSSAIRVILAAAKRRNSDRDWKAVDRKLSTIVTPEPILLPEDPETCLTILNAFLCLLVDFSARGEAGTLPTLAALLDIAYDMCLVNIKGGGFATTSLIPHLIHLLPHRQSCSQRLWNVLKEEGNNHLIPSLCSRFFDVFFGECMELDLRSQDIFWKAILDGLASNGLDAKYSLWLLKRVVEFSSRTPMVKPNVYFTCDSTNPRLLHLWKTFFLLYDTANETYVHLVEPLLPKYTAFLKEVGCLGMHICWWQVLIRKGFEHCVIPIRRRFMESVLSGSSEVLSTLSADLDFFFSTILPATSQQHFYASPGLGITVSPFGKMLSSFICDLGASMSVDGRNDFFRKMLHAFSTFTTPIPVLYLLSGMLPRQSEPVNTAIRPWGRNAMKTIQTLFSSEMDPIWNSFQARLALRRLLIQSLPNFDRLSRRDVETLVTLLVEGLDVMSDSAPLCCINDFVQRVFNSESAQEVTVKAYLQQRMSEYIGDPCIEKEDARTMGCLSLFVEAEDVGAVGQVIMERLMKVKSPYLPKGSLQRALQLMRYVIMWWSAWRPEVGVEFLFPEFRDRSVFTVVVDSIHGEMMQCDNLDDIETQIIVLRHLLHFHQPDTATLQKWTFEVSQVLRSSCAPSKTLSALRIVTIIPANILEPSYIPILLNSAATGDKHEEQALSTAKYEALAHIVQHATAVELANVLSWALDTIDLEIGTSLVALANMIGDIFNSAISTSIPDSQCTQCISKMLALLKGNWRETKCWWDLYDAFLRIAFCNRVLSSTVVLERDALQATLVQAQIRQGIMPLVSEAYFMYWQGIWNQALSAEDRTCRLQSLLHRTDELIEMLHFGPVWEASAGEKLVAPLLHRRESDLQRELVLDDKSHEGDLYDFRKHDYSVRVRANLLLLSLDVADPEQSRVGFSILLALLGKVKALKPAKFANTAEHRAHIRLWCSVHLLLAHVPADEARQLLSTLLECLDCEGQASTRYYIEWAITRLLLLSRSQTTMDVFWVALRDPSKKAATIASLCDVVCGMARVYPDESDAGDEVTTFLTTAVNVLSRWVLSNHFTIRLLAQYAFHTVYSILQNRPDLHGTQTCSATLSAMYEFLENNEACLIHRAKCDQVYFVGKHHAVKDLCLEFLFYGGMKVSGVVDDEWIAGATWKAFHSGKGAFVTGYANGTIPVCARVERGAVTWVPNSEVLDASSSSKESRKSSQKQQASQSALTNVDAPIQKKILPWEEQLSQALQDVSFASISSEPLAKARLPLILCASLIEKPPNLGGLCRTLEIFGCRELLVHSKSVVRDPGFANTAVTAHHHLPISEVKVENLIDYLRNIKKMGYTVIGIEQCDRSSTLETFVFPEKAVILLGKEREGLPVEILREVQCVVEIPQFGVVRSLNVHVSGALVVWEYVKQMMQRQTPIDR